MVSLCLGVSLGGEAQHAPPQREGLFQQWMITVNNKSSCHCSHHQKKSLWLYCADSLRYQKSFFINRKEEHIHSARLVRQITLKRWMMWIPRRETKIEHRIIQQGRGSYICHFHSEVDSYLSSWVNKTDRFEFNFLFMLEVRVFLLELFYYQLLLFWKWYIRADTSTALTILCGWQLVVNIRKSVASQQLSASEVSQTVPFKLPQGTKDRDAPAFSWLAVPNRCNYLVQEKRIKLE